MYSEIEEINLKKKCLKKSVKSPVSWKENVRFLDSPDFEISSDFWIGCDVR
jgi:hypothetical protein